MANFSEIINQNQPVLVDFYADWCGPCQSMAPILEELKSEVGDSASVIKVNIDKNQKAASVYQVRSIPTFLLFKRGEILWRHTGATSKMQLKSLIESHL